LLIVFHTDWYCRCVEHKTEQLTGRLVGRLKNLTTSTSYETGRAIVTYLDETGIVYEVTLDGVELEQFTMRRYDASSPRLTRRLVHAAPVDAIAAIARKELAASVAVSQYVLDNREGVPITRQDGTTTPFDMPGLRKFVQTVWSDFKRPGRAGRSDVDYALLAREYVDEVRERGGLGAAKRVSASHNLSVSQIRNVLYEAQRRGLKTPAARGMAGGQLTEKALRLLAEVIPPTAGPTSGQAKRPAPGRDAPKRVSRPAK
jgi:hypothetical protein